PAYCVLQAEDGIRDRSVTGVQTCARPISVLDFHIQDTYFVVAHFHYVMAGTVVFGMFAGFYFWWPKMFGHKLSESIGKVHFWLQIGRASCRDRAAVVGGGGERKQARLAGR